MEPRLSLFNVRWLLSILIKGLSNLSNLRFSREILRAFKDHGGSLCVKIDNQIANIAN
jgi:hypothetical protein